jgi:hypothetical protein
MAGRLSREIMLGPDFVARAAATATRNPAERWMLWQPRSVRATYVREVLAVGGGESEQRIWMLRQPDTVRESYLREVAYVQGSGPEVAWMLRQPVAVRESYIEQVLM